MARRKTAATGNPSPHVPPVLDWSIAHRMNVNGRIVEPGTELSIIGEGGTRFVFVQHVTRPNGVEWIDVLETYRGTPQAYRSFRPDRIKTVHRTVRTRAAA